MIKNKISKDLLASVAILGLIAPLASVQNQSIANASRARRTHVVVHRSHAERSYNNVIKVFNEAKRLGLSNKKAVAITSLAIHTDPYIFSSNAKKGLYTKQAGGGPSIGIFQTNIDNLPRSKKVRRAILRSPQAQTKYWIKNFGNRRMPNMKQSFMKTNGSLHTDIVAAVKSNGESIPDYKGQYKIAKLVYRILNRINTKKLTFKQETKLSKQIVKQIKHLHLLK